MNNFSNKNTHTGKSNAKCNEISKLNEDEKKKLQVKDGQHNHHIDERGGA